jgi:hypothetical protein
LITDKQISTLQHKDTTCTDWGRRLSRGGLFLSLRHLAFISSDLELKYILKLDELLEVKEGSGLIPNSITVLSRSGDEVRTQKYNSTLMIINY